MTKGQNSGKTLKAQLFSAISMMLVASIALGTSTYAWFVNNSQVSVETMNFTASTSKALEIALMTKDQTTPGTVTAAGFKGVITNADISGEYVGMFDPNTLRPVSSVDTADFFINTNDMTTDGKLFTKFTELEDYAGTTAELQNYGKYAAKVIPLKLRASEPMDVYLSNFALDIQFVADVQVSKNIADLATLVATTDYAADTMKLTAAGATKLNNAKTTPLFALDTVLAAEQLTAAKNILGTNFKDVDDYAVADSKLTLAGAAKLNALINDNFTDAKDDIRKAMRVAFVVKGTDEKTWIYEMDQADVNGARNTTDYSATNPAVIHGAIKTIYASNHGTTPGMIETAAGQATTDATAFAAYVAKPADPTNGLTTAEVTGKTSIFELTDSAEEQEVTVYIWLEGTDKDCVTAVSSKMINVNMSFAGLSK